MDIKIIKSRRKTISLEIKRDGRVIVRAPIYLSKRDIDRFIELKLDWIEKHSRFKESAEKLSEKEISALMNSAKATLPYRVKFWAEFMGVSFNRVTIKRQVTRWGSCSSKKNINLNFLLMLCPEEVKDYVILHELCHLRHLDHSKEFWGEVERYCPDYKTHRKWLKENGSNLIEKL